MVADTIDVGTYGRMEVRVEQTSQSVSNWTSNVRVQIYVANDGNSRAFNNDGVDFGVYSSNFTNYTTEVKPFSVNGNSYIRAVDKYFTVTHNSDGKLTINVKGQMFSTGTSTFGGGGDTTVTLVLDTLATKPETPTKWDITSVTNNAISGNADSNGNGGSTVTRWQIRYRKTGTSSWSYKDVDEYGVGTVTGLSPKTEYEFNNRRLNQVGWSNWSATTSTTTHDHPDKQNTPNLSSVDNDSVYVNLHWVTGNGDSVDGYRTRWSKNSSGSNSSYKDTSGDHTLGGLDPKTDYWVWTYAHNKYGWGPASNKVHIKTHDHPDTPSKPTFSSIEQTRAIVDTHENASNGDSIDERRMYWNTSNTTSGATSVVTDGYAWLNDLPPGDRIYVWSRAHNKYGWSGYSPVGYFDTVAGAYVTVGSTRKKAVPYEKVGSVWKLLEPYAKSFGVWRNTG